MGKMCYRCMMPTVEGGVCRKCGEPELTAQGNGPKALPPGTKLYNGRITVGKKLGSGGFGITYIAFDHKLNARVALKEFLPNYLAERQGIRIVPKTGSNEAYQKAMTSFHKEARALYELRGHPNIVHVIGTFRENNTAYYTMELLEGESLLAFLKRRTKISGEEAFRLLFPVMDAVRYMHKRNILHRDISPDNVMLCSDPGNSKRVIPKLIDFGAAHVAIEGYSLSYPGVKKKGFSPLEQNWDGKYQGSWTDVYSLCATFYGAVVGTVPPPAVDRAEAKHAGAKAEDPLKPARQVGGDITPALDEVLMKGLSLNYQDRIQTMDELMLKMTDARNQETNETVIDLPEPKGQGETRPAGRRVLAWLIDFMLNYGAPLILLVRGGFSLEPLAQETLLAILLWPGVFLLNWILLLTARGTLGQLITGLKVQRDDLSGERMGAGYCLLYALLYPGPIGLICGIVYLASGKKIGPLEGFCQGTVMRRKESGQVSIGAVVISRSVSRPGSQENAAAEPKGNEASSGPPPAAQPAVRQVSQPAANPASGPRPAAAVRPSAGGQRPVQSGNGQRPPQSGAQRPPEKEYTARLVIRKTADTLANLNGKVVMVHSDDTLGKNPSQAKIVFSDPTISKVHCRFHYYEGRGWAVKDENSTNGTYINDQRLPSGGIAPLKPGTMIRVGKETLEFKA